MPVIKMSKAIRDALTEGYCSEAENWGPEYVRGAFAKLAEVPDGTKLPWGEPDYDLGEVTEINFENPEATDLDLSPVDFVCVGIDYFHLDHM